MRPLLLFTAAVVLAGCRSGNNNANLASSQPVQAVEQPPEVHEPAGTVTQVEMVNVDLHLDPALILRIRYLEGQFLPTRKGRPPTFDDKLSYIVAIDSDRKSVV